jgi:aryl-alcohol dehydrogenase-like predicted oxidoreductase
MMKTRTLGQMKTKQLGNSDLFITPAGYGSWAIGCSGWQFAWGKQNDDDSVAAIHRALELGVNDLVAAAAVYLTQSDLAEIETVAELAGEGQ